LSTSDRRRGKAESIGTKLCDRKKNTNKRKNDENGSDQTGYNTDEIRHYSPGSNLLSTDNDHSKSEVDERSTNKKRKESPSRFDLAQMQKVIRKKSAFGIRDDSHASNLFSKDKDGNTDDMTTTKKRKETVLKLESGEMQKDDKKRRCPIKEVIM